jgi:hypothetical protein
VSTTFSIRIVGEDGDSYGRMHLDVMVILNVGMFSEQAKFVTETTDDDGWATFDVTDSDCFSSVTVTSGILLQNHTTVHEGDVYFEDGDTFSFTYS